MRRTVFALGFVLLVVAGGFAIWYDQQGKGGFVAGHARIDTYALGENPNEVIIFFATGAGDIIEGPLITEEPGRVLVAVSTQVYVPARGTFKNLSATLGQTTVHLREPLAARSVINATTLAPVPRLEPPGP